MIEALYAGMGFPDACRLGKRLFKKQFIENVTLGAADKKAFQEDIDTITWQYTLKPTTIPIQPYEDEEREYLELNVLQVDLRHERRCKRLAEIIHRAIPYPLLLFFFWQGQARLTAADKRINRADSHKIVAEVVYDTGWLSMTELTAWQADFLADFRLPNFSYLNFYSLHQDMARRIVALNRAAHTGRYQPKSRETGPLSLQVAQLNRLEQLEQQVTSLRNQVKKEKNLGKQVNLNVRLKQLSDQSDALKNQL